MTREFICAVLAYLLPMVWPSLAIYADMTSMEQLLQRVRQYNNFSNVVVFAGAGVDPLALGHLHSQLSANGSVAQYIFNAYANDTAWNMLRHQVQDDTLSVVFCATNSDAIWTIVDRRLRRLRRTKLLVVLTAEEHTALGEMERLFDKIWDLQFLQVLVLQGARTFSYSPYPNISIFEVARTALVNPFPPISSNLRGYVISTSVENDMPRIFCVRNERGELRIHGFAYEIFYHFVRRLNATLNITNANVERSITSSVNMSDIMHRIGTRKLEITMHPYTSNPTGGIVSYPMFKELSCLIVPVSNEIPRYMYLLRPFAWSTWLLVFLAIAYVTCVLVWSHPQMKSSRSLTLTDRFSRCLLESITKVFFLPPLFQVHSPRWSYFFISVQLSVMGFFLTSWYSNLLSSFLTTFLVGDQVDTFDDLVAAKLPIMVKDYETHLVLHPTPRAYVQKVERLLVPVNSSVLIAHLLSFNRSFSYRVTEERWTFLALQQQYANKPIYRFSRICFGMPGIGYPMRLDSHLEHPMTQFIMDVQMAGLDKYWLTSDFKDALAAGYVHLIENFLPFKALDLKSVRLAFYVVLCGWMVASLVFLFEVYI